jgi:hypothetical protein
MLGAALKIGLRGLGNLSKGASKLGKSAVKGTGAAIVGGAGGFFGGLMSGATGGKLGGEAPNSNAGNGPSSTRGSVGSGGSFFGFSTSSNTRVTGPTAETKDNCCCCDQTLSLLSSIDETLKRSLYVSQRLGLQNSEMMAENANNQKIAGLGGSGEAARDSAEKVGFGLGQMILSSLALFVAGNAGKIFDPNRNEDGGFDPLGGAVGALAGGFLGGKKKIVNAAIGGVAGSDILGDGVYKAKSEEGMIGGAVGNVGGGILGGMAGGAAAGAAAGMVFGPGAPIASSIFALVGSIAGGIIASGLFEDAGEAIGDTVAGKFNEEVDGKKIGKDAASEFNKNARGKRNPAIPPMTPGAGVLKTPPPSYTNINGIEGYMQTVATREGNVSGGNTHDLSRSSAAGRYGFLNQFNSETPEKLGTWDENLIKVMPETAKLSPEQRFNMMKDPVIENKVMKKFTEDNISSLEKGLRRTPTWEEVDMAHLLGAGGAIEFIKAYEKDPNTPARNVLPQSVINANRELTAGSLQDLKNRRTKTSGLMAAGNTRVSAISPLPAASSVAATSPVALPIPLITPRTNTGQIDYFALRDQPQKYGQPGQNTVMLPSPAPTMQPQKSPNVPYPVDGPRLPMSASQFWAQGGWAKSM